MLFDFQTRGPFLSHPTIQIVSHVVNHLKTENYIKQTFQCDEIKTQERKDVNLFGILLYREKKPTFYCNENKNQEKKNVNLFGILLCLKKKSTRLLSRFTRELNAVTIATIALSTFS